MAKIRAVLVQPDAPAHLALGMAPTPSPGSSEALVGVAAIPLNRGEVNRLQVAEAVDDVIDPSEGARVIGLMPASVGFVPLARGFTGKAVLHVED